MLARPAPALLSMALLLALAGGLHAQPTEVEGKYSVFFTAEGITLEEAIQWASSSTGRPFQFKENDFRGKGRIMMTGNVLIPKEHRHPAIFGSRHYLAAPCMNLDEGETMMAQVISRYRLERIEAQSAEEDGLATRMAAHRDLYDLGNVSAARLHIPLGGATPDQIQRAIDEIERSERASAGKVNHAAEAMDMSEDAIGFLVTTDESVQPDAPASTDQLINFAADPEEGVPATIEKPSSPIRRAKPAANRKPHSPKGRPPRQRWTNMIGENDE